MYCVFQNSQMRGFETFPTYRNDKSSDGYSEYRDLIITRSTHLMNYHLYAINMYKCYVSNNNNFLSLDPSQVQTGLHLSELIYPHQEIKSLMFNSLRNLVIKLIQKISTRCLRRKAFLAKQGCRLLEQVNLHEAQIDHILRRRPYFCNTCLQ